MNYMLMIVPLYLSWNRVLANHAIAKKANDMTALKHINMPIHPVGLLNIASYIHKFYPHIKIVILDYNTIFLNYFEELTTEPTIEDFLEYGFKKIQNDNFKPDVVAFSVLFNTCLNFFEPSVKYFNKKFPLSAVIAGGHFASAAATELLPKHTQIDAICYGEGEIPCVKMLEAVKNGSNYKEYFENDPLWLTKDKMNRPDFSPKNEMIQNLDEIPPYELELLVSPDKYYKALTESFFYGNKDLLDNAKDLTVFATRGCCFNCIFCAAHTIHGRKIRRYSVERIKSDILYYNKKYGINSFPFTDDHFLSIKKDALEILEFIHAHGFYSRCINVAYTFMNKEIMQALKKTDTTLLYISLDGLNEEFLRKTVKKPANFKKLKEVIDIARLEKVQTIVNVLVGFPGETKKSIEENIPNLLDFGANWYKIYVAVPLVGSELYEICKKNNYIKNVDDESENDFIRANIETPDFTPDWVAEKAYEINLYINFVHNYDMRVKAYAIALYNFERVFTVALEEHAFAYYFAAICTHELGDKGKAQKYATRYAAIVSTSPYWGKWVAHFNLPELALG